LARSHEGFFTAGAGLTGTVDLPTASTDVRVQILDATGQLIKELNLGAHAAGSVPFAWAGDTDSGALAPDGRYTIAAQYLGGGQVHGTESLVHSIVESVSLRPGGLGVQLRGLGEFSFNAIEEIG
jgi:flagellar basal-body rod modification protein FlgD